MRLTTAATTTASVLLAAIAGLHAAWGLGSAVPMADRASLADAVFGGPDMPPPAACFAVAGLLALAGAAVSGQPAARPRAQQLLAAGTVLVLGARGTMGLLGGTAALRPGVSRERFLSLDRRVYSPLCIGLAALAAPAVFRRQRT